MLQPKTVHYPSGFPMPQTPPVFVCSSPGPDPYESNGNLYEELDQPDSYSVMSQHDRSLPQTDRASDHLNSSAETASATDDASPTSFHDASDISSNNRNMGNGMESEVERRNRINAQLSNPAANVATIFRDRSIRYHPARANANYYAPPQHMMANRTNNAVNNCHFLTNPRTVHCWNNQSRGGVNICSHYEPVFHESLGYLPTTSSGYQTSLSADNSNLRSPHHINQNSINSRKNLWSWLTNSRT